jgi:hypothetical protein
VAEVVRKMSSGGVPLWVPIVSAVGSLGLGALVGAFVAHRLREHSERQREYREQGGLLRLVLIEMLHNQVILYRTHDDLAKIEAGYEHKALVRINLFKMDTWESVRVRLAQLLLVQKDFDSLATHYGDLQDTIALNTSYREGATDPSGSTRVSILDALDRTERSRMKANETLVKYLGDVARNVLRAPWIASEDQSA